MSTTQAVILARGLGTRMRRSDGTALGEVERAAADAGLKAMMPIGAGARPFLDYLLSALADAGVTEVALVVAPEHGAVREQYTGAGAPQRVALRFAVQAQPRGTADAVYAARDALRAAPFLVLNGDNLYSPAALRAAAAIGGNGLVAYDAESLSRESGIAPERILRYALIDVAPGNVLRGIREKPAPDDPLATAAQRWVSMNLWSFTPLIFTACERVRPSPRGELELQDAVTIGMRDLGAVFTVAFGEGAVLDLSQRADVALVRERLAGFEARP